MSTISVSNVNDGDAVTAASVNNQINTIVNDYNGNITSANLASNSVTTAKIINAAVTADKLATGAATNTVSTLQTTTSATMTDLSTVGPTVTVTIGANGMALVTVSAYQFNSGANETYMGYAISGASTVAAVIETHSVVSTGTTASRFSLTELITGLTPGSTTFTAKYAAAAGTGSFRSRIISVIPL